MDNDRNSHLEFIGAAAAIYAWMSAADGEISKSEINSFIEYLNSLEYMDEINEDDFEKLYLDLLVVFERNFDDGLNRAQARIETFRGNNEVAVDLLRLARKALIADNKFSDAEEKALKEMAVLLGIEKNNIF